MRSSAGCRPPPRPPGPALPAGRPGGAEADAQQGLALAATHGNHLLTTCGLGVLATSSLRGGDLAAAVGYVRSYQDRMARHGPGYGQTRCLVVAAQLAEARQDTEAAAEIVARLQLCLRQHPGVLAGDLTASGWLVRFALAQGNREDAEAVGAAAAELAAGSPGLAGVTAAGARAGAPAVAAPRASRSRSGTPGRPRSRVPLGRGSASSGVWCARGASLQFVC